MDGEVIKNYLRGKKISVSEVARRMGVPQQNLASCLNSKDIKTGVLENVAEAIGISPAYFYTGDNSSSAVANNSPNATVTSNNQQETVIRIFEKQLDVKDRQIESRDRHIDALTQVILKK